MADGNDDDGPPRPPSGASPPGGTDPPELSIQAQVEALINERGYDPVIATKLARTWKCEECKCPIGAMHGDDYCECDHDCHYDPDEPFPPAAQPSPESVSPETAHSPPTDPNGAQESTLPADQPPPGGSVNQEGKQEGSAQAEVDEEMRQAAAPTFTEWTMEQLYEKLCQLLNSGMQEADSDAEASPFAAAAFAKLHTEATKRGFRAKKENALPAMTQDELSLLLSFIRILVTKSTPLHKFKSALSETVNATFRSSWSLERILADRQKSATAPPAVGPNAWSQKTPKAMQETLAADSSMFRFDHTVFSGEESKRLRKLCEESYSFADSPQTRQPQGDEWTVILGIMTGTIAVRAHPQFLKRCCNLTQFQWMHYQMIRRAEGELYATLPAHAKVFNYNQTAKRLTDAILSAAVFQKLDQRPVDAMLHAVKTLSYNDELKSIHFFFDSKMEAIQFEGMIVPFRNLKLTLKNPDARYREIVETPTGERSIVIRQPKDGLQDNRYDSQYRARVMNLTRTMDVDKLAKFLNELTDGAIKMAIPIDSYGAKSEHSLTWDFIFHSHRCPAPLEKINRIMWNNHALMIIHQGRQSAAPCHQCADTGHQASACTRSSDEWITDSTLVVTADMIAGITTTRDTWTTPEEARRLFDSLGTYTPPVIPTTETTTPVNETPGASPAAAAAGETQSAADSTTTTTQTTPSDTNSPALASPEHKDNSASVNAPTAAPPVSTPSASPSAAAAPPPSGNDPNEQPPPAPSVNLPEAPPPATPTLTKPDACEEWKTAMSRFNARAKNGSKKTPKTGGGRSKEATGESSKLNNATNGNRRQHHEESKTEGVNPNQHAAGQTEKPKGQTTAPSASTYPTVLESDTESDNEEDDDDCSIIAPPQAPAAAQAGRNDNGKIKRLQQLQQLERREETEALDAAIARSNMERVGMTIHRLADRGRPPMDKDACLNAIRRAQEDKSRVATSRKGTIEAIRGTLIDTPPTGNCFYMAIAECLLQTATAANKNREVLLELATMVKFDIYLANLVDPRVELTQSAAGRLLEFSEADLVDLPEAELIAKIAAHYAEVAMSSSELTYTLPRPLWGHTDAVRLLAKGIQRTIFVITATSDPDVSHHMCFTPQRVKDMETNKSVATAVIHQLSYHEWLEAIQREVEADLTPIVLSHTPDHYNAVLMHHDEELMRSKVPTKARKITELWGPAPVKPGTPTAHGTQQDAGEDAEEVGPTRDQLLQSQSSVQALEILRALSQDNWTRHEKKAAIDALVAGQGRFKELLVFWEDPTAMSDDDFSPAADGAEHEDKHMESDSDYTPPVSASPGTDIWTSPATSRDDAMDGGSLSPDGDDSDYLLPTPADRTKHSEWGQREWASLVTDWADQIGVQPPGLAESGALYKFAVEYPEIMSELGRHHPNPFIVLEHFTDQAIKDWCHAKRMRYCLSELTRISHAITDLSVQAQLRKWIDGVRGETKPAHQLKAYREIKQWTWLREHAADELECHSLLTRNYNRDCAYVLALDELFPSLAADILRAEGAEHTEDIDLIQLYHRQGTFAVKLKVACKDKEWDVLMEYVRSVGIHLSQPSVALDDPSRY